MKRRIISLACVFAAAVVLLSVYFIFFKEKPAVDKGFVEYQVTDKTIELLKSLDEEVEFVFSISAETMQAEVLTKYIYDFAKTYESEASKITVSEGESDYVTLRTSSKSISFGFEDFFLKNEYGDRYTFTGERLYSMAIIELAGKIDFASEDDFPNRSLPGFDSHGCYLASGRPFIYKNITRSDIQTLRIVNEHGDYKIFRDGSDYYLEGAELCSMDAELFSALVVNCTYMLSLGELPEPMDLAEYGLDSEENASAVIEIVTNDNTVHKILIGDIMPNNGGYYAKYDTKPSVFILDTGLKTTVLAPVTNVIVANLGYTISDVNQTYLIEDLLLRYRDFGKDIYITQKKDITFSSNTNFFNAELENTKLIHDKSRYSGEYSNWKQNINLVGINSTDGSTIQINIDLTNNAINTGKYSVKFGLLKSNDDKAVIPGKIYLEIRDGDGYKKVAEISNIPQADGTYREYTLEFESAESVKNIRMILEVPAKSSESFVVLDEITVYADGKDAIPNESITGLWKMISPEDYISPGMNYALPDTANFSELLYGIATLAGDKVVAYDVRTADELAEYNLDNPMLSLSFKLDIYRSYIFISDKNENGNYYVYATITYIEKGEEKRISSGIIAEISVETAPWIELTANQILERAVFSMYIDKIDKIEFVFGGTEYIFDFHKNNESKLEKVTYKDVEVNLSDFRGVYLSLLNITHAGNFEYDENASPQELLRFTMRSELKDTELVFYRYTSSRVYYERDGVRSEFYVLYSDIATIISNIGLLIEGKTVPRS